MYSHYCIIKLIQYFTLVEWSAWHLKNLCKTRETSIFWKSLLMAVELNQFDSQRQPTTKRSFDKISSCLFLLSSIERAFKIHLTNIFTSFLIVQIEKARFEMVCKYCNMQTIKRDKCDKTNQKVSLRCQAGTEVTLALNFRSAITCLVMLKGQFYAASAHFCILK